MQKCNLRFDIGRSFSPPSHANEYYPRRKVKLTLTGPLRFQLVGVECSRSEHAIANVSAAQVAQSSILGISRSRVIDMVKFVGATMDNVEAFQSRFEFYEYQAKKIKALADREEVETAREHF